MKRKQKSKKTTRRSPSFFPPEIIHEILLKATVKSLLRCKAVCKEWYSLISDHQFIKTHYTLSCTDNINYAHHRLIYNTSNTLISCPLYDVLFHNSVSSALPLENPFQPQEAVRIVGSCNGLLCVFVPYQLFIYNPSTRMCNGIPLPFRRPNSKPEADWYSFGYDESTADYKIVELTAMSPQTLPFGNKIIKGQVYSLNTGKWKTIGDYPYGYSYPVSDYGICSNGALHWVAMDESSTNRIVSFDLKKEIYGQVSQFDYDESGDLTMCLGVLRECLCGLCYYSYSSLSDDCYADLWVMKVYGVKESWTKVASFANDNFIHYYMAPLFLSNDGKVLTECHSRMVIYNLEDSSSPKKMEELLRYAYDARIVVESLVSPFPPLGSGKGKSASRASSKRKHISVLKSESYWLSRIRESEDAAMHHISLGFFKLALEAGCQNIKQLRDELVAYNCRHNLLGLGESAKQVFQSYHILKQQEKR